MNTWKEAILLAKFELKSSQAQLFLCWLILTILSLIFLTSFKGYVEENYIGFDIFFLLVISLVSDLFGFVPSNSNIEGFPIDFGHRQY
ncbi:hypothetical protein ACFSKI_06210 [Pseudogracilibacillus auburnensis]|nr:hypothetical protein [Pseudogracilibacillus auburnensis]